MPTLEVQLECYEGPLAVLITLIKRNKISIWDIPISTITERFLQYVELVRDLNLRIAEDFIEMASLLIFIKSKMLLPANDNGNGEEDPGKNWWRGSSNTSSSGICEVAIDQCPCSNGTCSLWEMAWWSVSRITTSSVSAPFLNCSR